MGLRRRLSKKWSETVNGVLSGPGVDVDTVNTDNLNNESYPEEYGAEGDGSTDDYQAIQDCLTNEETVALKPNTTYLVEFPQTLLIPSNTTLYGPPSATLQWTFEDTDTTRIFIENADPTSGGNSNIHIGGGFTIDGGADAEPAFEPGGMVNLHNVTDCVVDGLKLRNGPKHNMEVSHAHAVHIRWLDSRRPWGDDCLSVSDGSKTRYGSVGDSETEGVFVSHLTATEQKSSNKDLVEVDDGPKFVSFEQMRAVDEAVGGGFSVGTHPDETRPGKVVVRDSTLQRITLGSKEDSHKTVSVIDSTIKDVQFGQLQSTNDDEISIFRDCEFDNQGAGDPTWFVESGRYRFEGCEFINPGSDAGSRFFEFDDDVKEVVFKDCYWNGGGNVSYAYGVTTDNADSFRDIRPRAEELGSAMVFVNLRSTESLNELSIEYPDWDSTLIISAGGFDGDLITLNVVDDDPTWSRDVATLSDIDYVRWNGVIGGGPFANVDLTTLTGQYNGDEAVSNGTSASASDGDMAIWDNDTSQWNIFNVDATE